MIHPTAVVHKATQIPESASIGAYAVIEDGVVLGEGTSIAAHAIIRAGSCIGKNCVIDSHVVVGGLPQDLGFDPITPSGVEIGDNAILREGVTVSRATQVEGMTRIGQKAFLMANSHVAHDCQLGEGVILANGVLLAGHVNVGNKTFIGGNAAVHQFCRIGRFCMVGGLARVSQDIPPFTMAAERNELIGLNLIGLQRNGFERKQIAELKKLYQRVFHSDRGSRRVAEFIREELASNSDTVLKEFLDFIAAPSKKGIASIRKGDT